MAQHDALVERAEAAEKQAEIAQFLVRPTATTAELTRLAAAAAEGEAATEARVAAEAALAEKTAALEKTTAAAEAAAAKSIKEAEEFVRWRQRARGLLAGLSLSGVRLVYMDHTSCHQLNRALAAK